MRAKINKVVLAYSGGLDTSCAVRWIRDTYGAKVICFSAFLGETGDRNALAKRARSSGASKIYIKDLKAEFAADYIRPALWAHARYEGKYYLATALGRPLISKYLIKVAQMEKAGWIAHGSTGKGNDQVRIEVSARALNPKIKIIAPLREWSFASREEEIDYAKKHGLPVAVSKKSPYSIDKNIWGASIECGVLEDPWQEPPQDAYSMTKPIGRIPKKPLYLVIDFENGIPVALDRKRASFAAIIEQLNKLGGRFGVGRIDQIENRLVGIKSREIYEAPAAAILHRAHGELESLVLDREFLHYKRVVSEKYAELVYFGLWFTPLRVALDQFFAAHQKRVTGSVRFRLDASGACVVGRKSPYSRYSKALATYSKADQFDRTAAEGFMKIWGLPYEGTHK